MATPPDPLIETIAQMLRSRVDIRDYPALRLAADVLAAVAATGRLLPEGTHTDIEYAMQVEGQAAPWGRTRRPERALERLDAHREAWPDHPVHVVERRMHETPWEPSLLGTTPDTTGTQEGA